MKTSGSNTAASAFGTLWSEASRRLSALHREVARRSRLAREPGPEGVTGPPARLLLRELRDLAPVSWSRSRNPVASPPARNPQPVMLLPGFGSHPKRMRPMYEALRDAGHKVEEWGLGFNLGPTPENFRFLMLRVAALARNYGEPVALVGWSLGGLFAREIAARQPDHVSMVITMGTPFSGDPRANNAWRAYQAITGHAVDEPPIETGLVVKPPVPTVALWSPRDGIISPRSAAGWPHERDRAIALRCTHMGFANRPEVIAEVMRQLDWED